MKSTESRLLLDVNVWIALFDETHSHHAAAARLISTPKVKIATCPLTENGAIRILNLPSYSKTGPLGFHNVKQQIQQVCNDVDHEFWPDDVTLRQAPIDWSRVMGHNQVTDAYLLALAVSRGGCLTSFDHRIALSTVTTATAAHLRLI
jgi:toxin-antitoxin system PIN domain toxin